MGGLKSEKEYIFNIFLENIKKITDNDFENYYDKPTLDLFMIYVPLKVFISRNSIVLKMYQKWYPYGPDINPSFLKKYCIETRGDIPLVEMIINCENPEDFEEILRKDLIEEVEKKKRKREGHDDDDDDDDDGNKRKKRRLQFKIGTNYYHFGKNLFF
jgi:hypothetical protein